MELTISEVGSEYDWENEAKAFDDSKMGVKGLVDSRLTKVPRIFIHSSDNVTVSAMKFPIIDLAGIHENATKRSQIVYQIRTASETWGFFQIVNHGILVSLLEGMKYGVRQFHEQDNEVKKNFYRRDFFGKVAFLSNIILVPPATWADSLTWTMAPDLPDPKDLPEVCRDITMEYSKQVKKLGYTLLELLSEALGLHANHLKEMECAEKILMAGHYYPACPQPELTLGARRHVDSGFVVVVLQDQVGGLQVFHENQWMDTTPMPAALEVNIGYSLQVLTNARFKAVEHRVVVNRKAARVSVATGFGTVALPPSQPFGPIKQLLTDKNPPKYKEATMQEHFADMKGKRSRQNK